MEVQVLDSPPDLASASVSRFFFFFFFFFGNFSAVKRAWWYEGWTDHSPIEATRHRITSNPFFL
jgi:hypothetical protein